MSDAHLINLIGDIQDELPGYGYRRVSRELKARGHAVNHKRIARITMEGGLGIKPRKRFVKASGKETYPAAFPILYRNVIRVALDRVSVSISKLHLLKFLPTQTISALA